MTGQPSAEELGAWRQLLASYHHELGTDDQDQVDEDDPYRE